MSEAVNMPYVSAADAPLRNVGAIKLYDEAGFRGLRAAGRLAAGALDEISPHVCAGVTTAELDARVFAFARRHEAWPAPLGYRGFPKSICTSVNRVVCHGIPSDKALQIGDIVNVDVTLIKDGWHGDCSRMFAIGPVSRKAERLIEVTREALERAITLVRPGARTGDLGHAIQSFVKENRMSVVRDFCGHGIGRLFHDSPNILHFGRPGEGHELRVGMVFTIEPMVNCGGAGVKILRDGWTAVTRDRSLSAQIEHTIGVTADGCEAFTRADAP